MNTTETQYRIRDISFALVLCLIVSAVFVHGCGDDDNVAQISIRTVPIDAPIYVDGILMGEGRYTGEYPTGAYVISFGFMDKLITPLPQMVVLSSAGLDLVGTYVLTGGMILVSSNIQGVSQVVNENTVGIQQITSSSSDLARIAAELQDLVSHFKVA